MDIIYEFLNRCECGISRFGFCHYCGDNIIINVIIFILVFVYMFSLFCKKF